MELPLPANQRLQVPSGFETIEGWLVTQDNQPRAVPFIPESDRLALVICATDRDFQEPTMAYVILGRQQLDQLLSALSPYTYRSLFFCVTRLALLKPQICPELTAASWESQV